MARQREKRTSTRKMPAWGWAAGAAIVLGLLYVATASHDAAPAATSPAARALPPGAGAQLSGPAPEFSLTDLHGGTRTLGSFRGKVVILDFWATWCPPCKREIPDFISLQSTYGDRGLQVVGIALDEEPKVRAFADENGMNYPVLIGNDAIAAAYGGIEGIPTTFIIDRQGTVVRKFEGFAERAAFEREIAALL